MVCVADIRALACMGLAAAVLQGCASTRSVDRASATGWPLLAPSSLGAPRTAQQILRVAFNDREATLNCAVSVTEQAIAMVGTTAMGVRAFTVKYDGVAVQAQSHLPLGEAGALPPERLMNDLQLVYWPLSSLRTGFSGSGWEVTEPFPGTRRLRRAGRLVAEVHYAGEAWSGRSWLVNFEFGYSLGIESKLSSAAP